MLIAVLGVTLAGLPPLAVAADDDSPDVHFYQKAAEGNLAEVDLGLAAHQRSTTPGVVQFGDMMVKDHMAANARLRELAVVNHVDLPTQPGPAQVARQATLKTMNGLAFDKAYVEWQILQHKDAIALFKEESASGDDVDARRYATETLPTLQAHLAALLAMPTVP